MTPEPTSTEPKSGAPTHADITSALDARKTWERRQATWYQMRHDGLRRTNPPWANAADMHFPLADSLIEKLKPYYIGQIFATDTVASFIGLDENSAVYQSAAGQWFDYQLKQASNFESEMCITPDVMLQTGKCPVKVYWDAEAAQLKFEAINPIYLIVPPWTARLEHADWIVHEQHYSEAAYRRLPGGPNGFKQDEETIRQLTGASNEHDNTFETQKLAREGLAREQARGKIVIWETYFRDASGKWRVKTLTPAAPIELRPEFGLPYNAGIFAREMPPPPFAEFSAEVKERGFYSARGVCERVKSFEQSLCKDWNTWKDYQTLCNSPLFYAENGVPQNTNLRMVPGQILPFKLQSVAFNAPPVDIQASMQATRQVAQELTATPDVGTGRTVDPSKNKTAAETNLIASIMGQTTDARSRIFRGELGHLLNLAWGIAIQYQRAALAYFFQDQLQKIDPHVFDGKFRIEPNGSADNLNRGMVLQRAVSRWQMFRGDPEINQRELKQSVLEADDPRLVKRLLLNEGTAAAEQLEDQAQEIAIMLLGFPAQVRPSDDDGAHIQSAVGFVQRRATLGEPLSGETLMLLHQHVSAHAEALKKKQPPIWQQQGKQITAWLAQVQQQAQALLQQQQQQMMLQQQAMAAQGGNVVPMPGAAPAPVAPGAMPQPPAGPQPLGAAV